MQINKIISHTINHIFNKKNNSLMKTITSLFLFIVMFFASTFSYAQELVTNGDFEAGTTGWIGNASNVVTEGGNKYNFANVAAAVLIGGGRTAESGQCNAVFFFHPSRTNGFGIEWGHPADLLVRFGAHGIDVLGLYP